MRKILLISLAAVIVAGGLAITAYGQDKPEREGPPRRGKPGGEGQRRGPPRPQLTEEQQADLAKLMKEGKVGDHLMKALAKFQEAVKKIVGDDERAVRMVVFQAIMRQMRPPEEGDRDRPGRRPDRRRRPPGGPPPPE